MGLFKPIWMMKNSKMALKAVERITDEVELERIVKEAPDYRVCCAAVRKIKNQETLQKLVYNRYIERTAVSEAVNTITDQNILCDIAKNYDPPYKDHTFNYNYSYDYVRELAILKINDVELLKWLAKNDKYRTIRELSERRLDEISKAT